MSRTSGPGGRSLGSDFARSTTLAVDRTRTRALPLLELAETGALTTLRPSRIVDGVASRMAKRLVVNLPRRIACDFAEALPGNPAPVFTLASV